MKSFTSETQRPVFRANVIWCFVLLPVISCCSGVLLHETGNMADPLRSDSESSTMPDMAEQLGTTIMDLGSLLDAGHNAVVTLVAGDTRLAAHVAVLASKSPVLAAMVRPDMLEASGSEVNIPDVEGPVLRQLVAFLYTGRAPQLPGVTPQLVAAAKIYGVSGINDYCEQHVPDQLSVENAATTAILALRDSCHSLMQAVIAFIRDHMEVMATQGWAEAVHNHPGNVVHLIHLLAETSATAATDSMSTSIATTTANPTTVDGASTSTAATPIAPMGCDNTQPPDAAAVSFFRSLSGEERNVRLREAARKGAEQELRVLLAAGVDMRLGDGDGWTALHNAVRNGHVQVGHCLLEAGAGVDARTRWFQFTPLHVAAFSGQAAMVRLLVDSSADVDARDKFGYTPLHWAAMTGQARAVAALLKAGADRTARDNTGRTPLDLARRQKHHYLKLMLQ